MTRSRMPVVLAVIAAVAIASYGLWRWRKGAEQTLYQGWIESQLIFVSPDEAGRVTTLAVREGAQVQEAQPLFALDADLQKAAVAEAEANLVNARITYQRAKELLQKNVGSQKVYDDAEASLRTAEARLNSARTRLDRRQVASPVTGAIQEVYFRTGEQVTAARPIVSILPPGNVRVRFFVPQDRLPLLRIGDSVRVLCDGCAAPLDAKISFISAQAEFTPPVIYSQEERARLVFRIEALPSAPDAVRVGQPVSVALSAPPPAKTSNAGR